MEFSINPMHRILSEEESVRNLFAKETRFEDHPAIPEFYAGREIFITGGSGFMGKVLIEKLLRSCPDIARIFVLIRSKKRKSPDERLKVITDLPLFGPIRQVMPTVLNKLTAIDGDVTELELGLSNEDVERMKNVSIVFHSAASVRFDDPLKYAVFMNTRGTHELFKFIEKLENVAAVLHVSTTYSNPDRYIVEEEIYPPVADWRKTIEICEKYDEDELNSLTGLYTNFMPNTYTFTKNLAEHIVKDYKDKLPLTLFRPSIVISSMMEPFPGWVDNFNGPVGLLVGSGIGITRTMYCNPDNLTDFTPVDVCIKAMIIAAWKRAHQPRGVLPVYNCASSNLVTITMGQVTDIGKSIAASTPLDQMLWTPGGRTTLNRPMNYIKTIFLQLLPALLVDLMLRIKGERTFLTRIQRKIFEANAALQYFVIHDWVFKNANFINLSKEIKLEDMKDFDYTNCFHYDIILYLRHALLGVKRYLLGDKDENLPRNIVIYKRLKLLDGIVKRLPYVYLFYFLFIKHDVASVLRNNFY